MVQNQAVYFTNPFDHPQLQDYYRQEHFWDGVDTTNPKLTNTPLYSELIINYLQYYLGSDRGFSDDQIVEELTKCVDTILQKFGGHPITQRFALKFLQLGFKEIGQEELLQHIDQTYKTQIVEFTSDTKEQSDFEKRMAGYATLKAGNLSPAATFTSPEGSSFDLKDIKNKYTVLAFWASWCPSCEEQMPLVETYAKAHTDVTVVAVSLDEDKDEFISAIKNYPSLTHSCDYTAWNSKIVEAYYIHASPTFIVLDDQQRIVGKYSSWEAAEQEL
jgi:thiol-disulfide isomerase/thioredoxin